MLGANLMKQITIIGSSEQISPKISRMAQELGRYIASRGAILITGGRDGVMEAASKWAKEGGGLIIGIVPGYRKDANPYVDVVTVIGTRDARNVINVRSGDVVMPVSGAAGTLSEIGLALKAGKKMIAVRSLGEVAEKMAGETIEGGKVLSAEEAIELAFIGS